MESYDKEPLQIGAVFLRSIKAKPSLQQVVGATLMAEPDSDQTFLGQDDAFATPCGLLRSLVPKKI